MVKTRQRSCDFSEGETIGQAEHNSHFYLVEMYNNVGLRHHHQKLPTEVF